MKTFTSQTEHISGILLKAKQSGSHRLTALLWWGPQHRDESIISTGYFSFQHFSYLPYLLTCMYLTFPFSSLFLTHSCSSGHTNRLAPLLLFLFLSLYLLYCPFLVAAYLISQILDFYIRQGGYVYAFIY